MKLEFGKYRGADLRDVPDGYLEWLISTRREELRLYEAEATRREEAQEADASVAERLVGAGYRVMAQKLHPDAGGSTVEMQELNRARDALRDMLRRDL